MAILNVTCISFQIQLTLALKKFVFPFQAGHHEGEMKVKYHPSSPCLDAHKKHVLSETMSLLWSLNLKVKLLRWGRTGMG